MKQSVGSIFGFVLVSLLASACDYGTLEYGYYYNPKNVVYKVFESLKNDDYITDWGILFNGKMTCYYSSEEGIALLKKTLGNPNTALNRLSLEQPVLLHENASSTRQEYRTQVIRNSTGETIITLKINCIQEYSRGSTHHYCSIVDLKNHVYGNPNVPVCEDL